MVINGYNFEVGDLVYYTTFKASVARGTILRIEETIIYKRSEVDRKVDIVISSTAESEAVYLGSEEIFNSPYPAFESLERT
jgi:hypothetical protein